MIPVPALAPKKLGKRVTIPSYKALAMNTEDYQFSDSMDTQETQWPESMNQSLLQKKAKVSAKNVSTNKMSAKEVTAKKVTAKKVAAKKVSAEAAPRNKVNYGQTPDIGKENCSNGLFDKGVNAASTMFEGGEKDDFGQGTWQETQGPRDMGSEFNMSTFL